MKFKKTTLIIFLLINLSSIYSYAEEIKKLKYGKVTQEELEMTKYELDTAAEAVVLYQYAEFNPQMFKFYQHYRIKILKKSGTSEANMAFYGKLKNFIKGATYNLENSMIVTTKLSRESIYEERIVGDIYRTRIAMPNVQVGSVFEISILMDGLPFSYEIQKNIPVQYCGVYFPQEPDVDIRVKVIGYLGSTFKGDNKWIYKDLPAFKQEPFITSDKDYRARMEFEIQSIKLVNLGNSNRTFFGSYATYWKDVTTRFWRNEYFGVKLDDFSIYYDQLVDSIKTVTTNEDEMVKLAFESTKKIKWDEYEACYASQLLRKTFELKQGNSADINLNLVLLLRKLGLTSYPVLFSTRSNGKISKYAPTIEKFNYVIAAVDLASGTKYLDATNEFYPYDMISEKILGCLGHPVDFKKPECSAFMQPNKKNKKSTFSNFKIDSLGNLSGTISIKRFDYNASDFKSELKSKTDYDSYISEFESKNSGWRISNYKFNNLKDPYKDFFDEYEVTFGNSLGMNDNLIFNPLAFVFTNQNPFQKDKRFLPISFPYFTEHTSIVSITIPTNYQVVQIPESIELTNNDKSIRFTYQITKSGNTITLSSKFFINKLQYETIEYASLRGVFEMMLKKQNELIILKKV